MISDLALTAINLILWICVAVGLVLGVLSFIYGGLSKRSVWFAITMIVAAAWAVMMLISYANDAEFQNTAAGWLNLPPVLLFYTAPMMALTYVTIPDRVRKLIQILAIIPVVVFSSLMVFAPNFLLLYASSGPDGTDYLLEFNQVTILQLGINLILLTVATMIIMTRARKEARTPLGKKLMRNVMIGFLCGFLLGALFNLLMSNLHWWHWLGPTATLIYAFTMYTAVIKYGSDEV